MEARINDGGNSGVYCRSTFGPQIPANNPRFPLGYEGADQQHARGMSTRPAVCMWEAKEPWSAFANRRCLPKNGSRWRRSSEGNHIIVKVNGKTTADYTDEKRRFTSGHIALQQHDPETVVEFRKIEIKELPPAKSENSSGC